MKYIEGVTLYDYLNRQANKRIGLGFVEKATNQFIYEKIETLIYKWHDLNFAHCDLNSKNIIIDDDVKVYFIDPYFCKDINKFNEDLKVLHFHKKELISK